MEDLFRAWLVFLVNFQCGGAFGRSHVLRLMSMFPEEGQHVGAVGQRHNFPIPEAKFLVSVGTEPMRSSSRAPTPHPQVVANDRCQRREVATLEVSPNPTVTCRTGPRGGLNMEEAERQQVQNLRRTDTSVVCLRRRVGMLGYFL